MANSASRRSRIALLAFARALEELREEGGVVARAARYRANRKRHCARGCAGLVSPNTCPQGARATSLPRFVIPIIRTSDSKISISRLRVRGFIIYPGKLSQADCFRIGTIGRVSAADVGDLVAAIRRSAWRDRLLRSSGFTDFLIAPMPGTSITNDTSWNRLAAAWSSAFGRTRARDSRVSRQHRNLMAL